MKKIITLLLTVLMVVSMGIVNASAEGETFSYIGKVTVPNCQASGEPLEYNGNEQVVFTLPAENRLSYQGKDHKIYKYIYSYSVENQGGQPVYHDLPAAGLELKSIEPGTYSVIIAVLEADETDFNYSSGTIVAPKTYSNVINKKSIDVKYFPVTTFSDSQPYKGYGTYTEYETTGLYDSNGNHPTIDCDSEDINGITKRFMVAQSSSLEWADLPGNATDNSMWYSRLVENNSKVKTRVPGNLTVGTYEVYYQVYAENDGPHYKASHDDELLGTFTVVKATFTDASQFDGVNRKAPTVNMSGYTYAQTATLPTPSLNNQEDVADTSIKFYYNTTDSTTGGTEWSDSITSTSLNAGTYYMYAEIKGDDNYNNYTTVTQSFTIAKAESPVTVEAAKADGEQTLIYNGAAQSLVKVTNTSGQTVRFVVTAPESNTPTVESTSPTTAKKKDAGQYNVYYVVEESTNYLGKAQANVLTTIAPKALTVNGLSDTTVTYDGEAHKPTVTVTGWEGSDVDLTYYMVAYDTGDYKAAGTYDTTVTIVPSANNYSLTTVTKTVTINQAEAVIVAADTTVTYYKNMGGAATIKADGLLDDFKELQVKVGGQWEPVPADKYTTASGSTIITLKESYLQTLNAGSDYEFKVIYTSNYSTEPTTTLQVRNYVAPTPAPTPAGGTTPPKKVVNTLTK